MSQLLGGLLLPLPLWLPPPLSAGAGLLELLVQYCA
jgi:hypothetical protein